MRAVTTVQLRERAENIIKLLLWSTKRVKLNAKAVKRNEHAACSASADLERSLRSAGSPVFESDLKRARLARLRDPLPLRIFAYDVERERYYVNAVCSAWSMVVRYVDARGLRVKNNTVDVEQIVVALLYSMREGKRHGANMLVPCDEFLRDNLPSSSDLKSHFGIAVRDLTRGKEVLNGALEHALREDGYAHIGGVESSK